MLVDMLVLRSCHCLHRVSATVIAGHRIKAIPSALRTCLNLAILACQHAFQISGRLTLISQFATFALRRLLPVSILI